MKENLKMKGGLAKKEEELICAKVSGIPKQPNMKRDEILILYPTVHRGKREDRK